MRLSRPGRHLSGGRHPSLYPDLSNSLQTPDRQPTVAVAETPRHAHRTDISAHISAHRNDSHTPAAGNYSPAYTKLNSTYHALPITSNKHWFRLGLFKDINTQLLISGIESNPGPETTRQLTACHLNINSVTAENKIDELHQFVETNNIEILALTETKLDNTVADNLYSLSGFHSPIVKHRTRNGGGVALYIHKSLPFQKLQNFDCDEEWVWAKIKTKNFTLLICCVYLPPNLSANRLQRFIANFSEFVSQAHTHEPTATLVLGDINAGNIYLRNGIYQHSGVTSFDRQLKNTADTLDLYQIIDQPTRITQNCANLRDLLFTSNERIIADSGTLSPFANLDHFPIYATLDISPPTEQTQTVHKTIWDYSKTDTELLTRRLLDTDWTRILDNDIDTATTQFICTLHEAAISSIPTTIRKHKSNQKPWVTTELRKNIRRRDRLFKLAKHKPTEYNWNRWRFQRNLVTSINRRLKHEHMHRLVQKLITHKRDPYKYHQTLRNITGRQRDDTIPPLARPDGDIVTDDFDKATLLNDYFASQSTVHVPNTHVPPQNNISTAPVPALDNIETTENEVLQMLNSLDANKSTGPDNLPIKLLKMTALLIAKPLSQLFNMSLSSGKYPNAFKEANVRPIFKNKGSPSDYTGYRPISILSALSKVLEKIVYKNIYTHLTMNSLLTEKQSGYRKHHNTEQQLLYLTHNLYDSLDSGRDFTAIYLDITKYFDKIWHKGLLHKCKNDFGLRGKLLEWLTSYLKDRKQRVQINGIFSEPKIINAGCPQGSVMGPLLALMYLDGLSKRTTNDVLFFADDTSLYASHGTTDMLATQLSLQQDLDEIDKYGQEWAITFNSSKTIQQTFSHKANCQPPALNFGGEPIPIHEAHKHLGMTFSIDLRFHQHVNEICRKVNKTLSPLYPIAKYLPRPILDQVYKIYVRPHFDYCDTIYDGHITVQDATRLETLQNRAARLTTGTLFRTSTDKLRSDLGWETLTIRRRIHRLTLYHKLRSPAHHTPTYLIQLIPRTRAQDTKRSLRNENTNTQAPVNTTSHQRSFF